MVEAQKKTVINVLKTKTGMKILIKGRLQQNTYVDTDTGKTIYYHEVVGKYWNG